MYYGRHNTCLQTAICYVLHAQDFKVVNMCIFICFIYIFKNVIFVLFQFPLPKPQGGKHANNPILCEDQQFAHQRMAKQHKVQYGVMDEDFISNISPFAPTDTNSRAAQLGIHNHKHNFRSKRNPNENNKVYGRRK